MRILYSSNAFWSNSGYGVQGRSLLPRLAELPQVGGRQNIAMFAWYGLEGGVHNVQGFRTYPRGNDMYGNDVLGAHVRDFGADIVITLIDTWVLRNVADSISPARWLPWLPIDHDPIPQMTLDSLKGAHLPLAYAKWGSKMLTEAGIANRYIPHGIETDTYRILHRDAVGRFRREVLKHDGHLTLMVAANKGYPDRKAFQVQLRAWAEFARDKPDAKIYVHTDVTRNNGGLDILALAKNLGIQDRLLAPHPYQLVAGFSSEQMSLLYNSADIFLGAAMAEGFGIPIIEAQACGVPVVTTDFSSMPELTQWGIAVPPIDKFWTQLNSWQAWPDWCGIVDALEYFYTEWQRNDGENDPERREYTSSCIHAMYGWDTIVQQYWRPLLAELAGESMPQRNGSMAVPA